MKREHALRIKVTEEERAEIERRAGGRGRVSDWLRRLALGDLVAPDGRGEVAKDDPRRRRRDAT